MIGNLYFYQISQEISISKQVWEILPWGNLKVPRPRGSALVSKAVQHWARESSLTNSGEVYRYGQRKLSE